MWEIFTIFAYSKRGKHNGAICNTAEIVYDLNNIYDDPNGSSGKPKIKLTLWLQYSIKWIVHQIGSYGNEC